MRWYVNDSSLHGQFSSASSFEIVLAKLNNARVRFDRLRTGLHTARTLSDRLVCPGITVRNAVQQSRSRDFRNAILSWLQKAGPFMGDDRLAEIDDFFEYDGIEVTNSGLGEATRRVKAGNRAINFSFPGSAYRFEISPLFVDHGLPGDRLGRYPIENLWTVDDLIKSALLAASAITSWQRLVYAARERFPRLLIPDTILINSSARARTV